jgi:hypothetical protein
MCVVSMIGDHYDDKWNKPEYKILWNNFSVVSREEFETLQKEVLEMKELLKKAIKYDEDNNQKDCHIDEKILMLKKIAALFNIDLNDILNKK